LWSRETSIFNRVAAVLLIAFVGSSVPIEIHILTEFDWVVWERIGVIALVSISIVLQFVGRRNLGFLVAIIAVIANFLWSLLSGATTIFTYDWAFYFSPSREMFFLDPLYLASLILLPLACILLIIGRPEWKLLGGKA
jgi:hypothetical protein